MVALTPTDNCELMHKSLRTLGETYDQLPFRTDRDGSTVIPRGGRVFQPGDKVFVMVRRDELQEIYRLCGFRQKNRSRLL